MVPSDAVIALTGQGAARDVGSVNGIGIVVKTTKSLFKTAEALDLLETGLQMGWNDMTTDIVLEDEFSNAGIVVTDLSTKKCYLVTSTLAIYQEHFTAMETTKDLGKQLQSDVNYT